MHLQKINDGVHALHDAAGLHVGHFKWINGQWKFKALGHDPAGRLVPGGGPLTHQHNVCFAQLDERAIRDRFFLESPCSKSTPSPQSVCPSCCA